MKIFDVNKTKFDNIMEIVKKSEDNVVIIKENERFSLKDYAKELNTVVNMFGENLYIKELEVVTDKPSTVNRIANYLVSCGSVA